MTLVPFTLNIAGTTLNIALPGDAGHAAALDSWELIEAKVTQFAPYFIVVSAGYDGHLFDPLGGLQYSTSTYYELTKRIVDLSAALCQGRTLMVLEGGYHLDALAASVADSFRAILGQDGVDPHSPDLFRDEPTYKVGTDPDRCALALTLSLAPRASFARSRPCLLKSDGYTNYSRSKVVSCNHL